MFVMTVVLGGPALDCGTSVTRLQHVILFGKFAWCALTP